MDNNDTAVKETRYDFQDDESAPATKKTTKDPSKWLELMSICFGEFGGTMIIVLMTCMGCTIGMTTSEHVSSMQMSLITGLSVMTAIHIFGHVSGAHVNPAVTISGILMGVVTWQKACLYVVSQVFGGLTGYAILLLVTPGRHVASNYHCVTHPSVELTNVQAFVVEVLVTFILCLAINAAWDERNADKIDSLSMRLGFIVAACGMAAGPYTGASMNPARSIGPALWNKNISYLYIYILGPLCGGALSGMFYKSILLKPKSKNSIRE